MISPKIKNSVLYNYRPTLNPLDISSNPDKKLNTCKDFLQKKPNFQAFFWVKEVNANQLTHTTNLKSTLGHDKGSITNSLQLIHKDYRKLYGQISTAIDQYCTSGRLGIGVKKFTFIVFLPYKTVDNQYWYIRQTNTIYEFNEDNQALSYLSWHDLIRPYNGEPLTFQIYTHQNTRLHDLEVSIKQTANYYQFLPFSERERQVLKICVVQPNLKAKEVAEKLNLALSTVYTHNRNILEKAIKYFSRPFRTMTQLADFLRVYEIFPTTT